ncbi:MAG TPA: hypothetical protein VN306_09420 [Mycobacterium sp.]|nr:hypothetical protein [Mycobacterium sp.]
MAYIRERETAEGVKYQVVWREVVRDDFGMPVSPPRARSHQQTYANYRDAKARRDELNAQSHQPHAAATDFVKTREAADLPFGHYARAWLDSLKIQVATGDLSQHTLDGYRDRLGVYALPEFMAYESLGAHDVGRKARQDHGDEKAAQPRADCAQADGGQGVAPAEHRTVRRPVPRLAMTDFESWT